MKKLSTNQQQFIEYLINDSGIDIVNKDIIALQTHALNKLNNIPTFDTNRRKLYDDLLIDYNNCLHFIRTYDRNEKLNKLIPA